jgi:hypothetical protein
MKKKKNKKRKGAQAVDKGNIGRKGKVPLTSFASNEQGKSLRRRSTASCERKIDLET